jgi:pimeloyl-ACP methyl ester carboxylesterase
MNRKDYEPPGQLIDIGDCRLHLHCAGAGSPAVVFEAALGASSLSWSLVQPGVARVTKACVYDRAGFGWSEGGPLPRTATRIADELVDLLRCARVPSPYILVSHSFGGLVARVLAARNPDLLAGLVFVDPAHPEEWVEPGEHERRQIDRGRRLCRHGTTAARLGLARAVAALIDAGALTPARALTRVVSRGGFTRADEDILAPLWKLPEETRRPLRRFWTQPKFFEALGSQIESICTSAVEAAGAGVQSIRDLPVVVISAANANERRRELHAALAAQSRLGRLVVAGDSGHWVPLDQPQVVVDEVVGLALRVRSRCPGTGT